MATEGRKSRIKNLLGRIFGKPGEEGASSGQGEALSSAAQKEDELIAIQPLEEVSPIVLTISERIGILKRTFEFEPALKSKLSEIESTHDLLFYMHDAILFRFNKLHEIGLIGHESFELLDSLNEKVGHVLARQSLPESEGDRKNIEELRAENLELKQQMAIMHAKYVKKGIITETELSQENEIKYLQSRVREQHSKLSIAIKRLKVLASYQEMVQSLRAKNSLLGSKLEHQARSLRTLTAKEPKQQELVSTVENLTGENRLLRTELERQSELFEKLKMRLPPEMQKMAEYLIDKNAGLHADLERKEAQLGSVVSSAAPKDDPVDNLERMNEENIHLKSSLGATKLIEKYMEDQKKGGGDPSEVIETLKTENQRLELALNAKEEQIKASTCDPASRQLMKAYSRLKTEYKELYLENKNRAQLYQQELSEKQALMVQVREKAALIKENQRLRTEVETSKHLKETLGKFEEQRKILKKERSEANSKYERALAELDNVNKKLAKVTTEYNLLVKEYENIFNV